MLLIIILNTSHIQSIILRKNITYDKNVTNEKSEHFLDCYSVLVILRKHIAWETKATNDNNVAYSTINQLFFMISRLVIYKSKITCNKKLINEDNLERRSSKIFWLLFIMLSRYSNI